VTFIRVQMAQIHASMTGQGTTDAELLRRVQQGDVDALGDLFDIFGADLFTLARRMMGSTADAEDVVQDVFLGLPEALRKYEEQNQPRAWLLKVTARVALSRLRSRSRKREVGIEAAAAIADPADRPLLSEVSLERALEELPETLRQVFLLKNADGFSHEEIAAFLNISVSASQVRLHRAVRQLRRRLTSVS
jgi:RNA polymerase sigma-70 factor (ECF subfamily)